MKTEITFTLPIIVVISLLCTILCGMINPNIGIAIGIVSIVYIVFIYVIGNILKHRQNKNEIH